MSKLNIFPECELHYVEQRSEEWRDLRRGRLTASEFGVWLTTKDWEKPNKTQGDALHTAVCAKLAELAKCEEPPDYQNWAMERGCDLEDEARQHFEKLESCEINVIGFAQSLTLAAGCSPDGHIMGKNEGVEIKCPVPKTHVKYVLGDKVPNEYISQCHGSMAVTGADAWWFMSYCPGLPTLKKKIERSELTEAYKKGLIHFTKTLSEQHKTIVGLWEQEYKR